MKKIILLLIPFFLSINIFAQEVVAKYSVTYGKFLKLGIAETKLNIKNNEYKISIIAKTTGMAKFLSNKRVEIYESYGKVINNIFIPKKFVKIKKDSLKKRIKTYTFDRKNKKILLHYLQIGKEKRFNQDHEYKTIEINKVEESILDYYAENDILSLFFNIKLKIQKFEDGKEYTLNAVGANKTKGVINILMPSSKQLKNMNKVLKTEDKTKFTAYINQNIFQSKRGELLLSLNNYGFCTFAVLKDVLLFGDIVGKMIEFKVKDD